MYFKESKSTGPNSPRVVGFYEADTGSVQYVVIDTETSKCALIDIVLGFDPNSARTNTTAIDEILEFVYRENLKVEWILDTHPHADHLMASSWLKQRTGAPTAIGKRIIEVSKLWEDIYGQPNAFDPRSDFDRIFDDGETFSVGNLSAKVMFSPGHTAASISYIIGTDAAFVHDTFMHVDTGTARADFPGGSSSQLYQTLQQILALPENTRLFVGHDYKTDEREDPAWEASVGDHKRYNKHVGGNVTEAEFVQLRDERDNKLNLPDRMLYALQFNLRGGKLPRKLEDGTAHFLIPVNKM